MSISKIFNNMYLPDEIINYIFMYMKSPTNDIIKKYFNDIKSFERSNINACYILQLNKQYNFKHIEIKRLLDAVNAKCPHCLNRLNPQEYLTSQMWFHKKLCTTCLQREQFRIVFEVSEIVLMFIITFYMVVSILYVSVQPIEWR